MVGAGVFLSTGFMAQSLTPGVILLAWLIGAVLALCGAKAYAEVARLVPRGGGEYRYLSALIHPSLGYLAGWASLLLGFSAPTALDALAAGAFARAVVPSLDPRATAALLVVALTSVHALGLQFSVRVQNALVAAKVLLLLGFVAVGLGYGTLAWPTWVPPQPAESTLSAVLGSLFYIAFAFSGWNAAVYAADEFEEADRNVPKSMLVGCAAVAALYLVVNFIFVANLTPAQGTVVFQYERFASLQGQFDQVTLGQAVMGALLGPLAAKVMSAVMLLLFVSAMSAMLLVGPRVYAAMANDGFLPQFLAGAPGRPPRAAVLLQGGMALLLLFTHDIRSVLSNVGAILVLFTALTVLGLFVARARAKPGQGPSSLSLLAAGVYVLSAGWMLFEAARKSLDSEEGRSPLGWVGLVTVVGLGAFALTQRAKRLGRTNLKS